MKDYRFSELKAHCDKMFEQYGEQACEKCSESEIGRICLGHFKNGVSGLPETEPRDMIELPYKEHVKNPYGIYFSVYYRDEQGCINMNLYTSEFAADRFISGLKNERK